MTLFGKFVFGILLLVVGSSLYFGLTSYVKHDSAITIEKEVKAPSPAEEMTQASSSESIASTTASSKKIPFSKFLTLGGSYMCSVVQITAPTTSIGTVFINGPLIRANFITNAKGVESTSSIIVRDGYVYSWIDKASSKGTKMKVVNDIETSSTTKTSPWNGEDIGDYTCEEWKVEDTIFNIPKTITFTEVK